MIITIKGLVRWLLLCESQSFSLYLWSVCMSKSTNIRALPSHWCFLYILWILGLRFQFLTFSFFFIWSIQRVCVWQSCTVKPFLLQSSICESQLLRHASTLLGHIKGLGSSNISSKYVIKYPEDDLVTLQLSFSNCQSIII